MHLRDSLRISWRRRSDFLIVLGHERPFILRRAVLGA